MGRQQAARVTNTSPSAPATVEGVDEADEDQATITTDPTQPIALSGTVKIVVEHRVTFDTPITVILKQPPTIVKAAVQFIPGAPRHN